MEVPGHARDGLLDLRDEGRRDRWRSLEPAAGDAPAGCQLHPGERDRAHAPEDRAQRRQDRQGEDRGPPRGVVRSGDRPGREPPRYLEERREEVRTHPDAHPGELGWDRLAHTRPTTLSHRGAPGGIRTPDLWLRRPMLYPAELRARERYLTTVPRVATTGLPLFI